MPSRSVEFFEQQFRRQVEAGEFALNSFERLALEHLAGDVLDLGCGLGNFALEAARRGHRVVALDASSTAIERIRSAAEAEGLDVRAQRRELADFRADESYDTVVCIGLLMFLARERASALLEELRRAVRQGGVAVVNVLVEGTTYLAMFDPRGHCVFGVDELQRAFADWELLAARRESFPAPGDTTKEFVTVIARRPSSG